MQLTGQDGSDRLGVGGTLIVQVELDRDLSGGDDIPVTVESSDSSVFTILESQDTHLASLGPPGSGAPTVLQITFDGAATGPGRIKNIELKGEGKGEAFVRLQSGTVLSVRNRPDTMAIPPEPNDNPYDDLRFRVTGVLLFPLSTT